MNQPNDDAGFELVEMLFGTLTVETLGTIATEMEEFRKELSDEATETGASQEVLAKQFTFVDRALAMITDELESREGNDEDEDEDEDEDKDE